MLTVTYESLQRETGLYLGYSRERVYSQNQFTDLQDVLSKASRMVYFPVVGDGIYQWSFMRRTLNLELVTATYLYDLPDDFNGLITPCFYYGSAVNVGKIGRESENTLLALYGAVQASGDPRYFAVRPRSATFEGRTLWEVMFYPVPDRARTLNTRIAFIPPPWNEANPYPLGGEIHGEMILEACLAAAEQKVEDTEGLHTKRFAELLVASITVDKDLSA